MMHEDILKSMRENIIEAQGCTEPIAIAYAASYASSVLGSKPDGVEAYLSGNVIKNAMIVCLPGTQGKYGIPLALALGALFGDKDKQLKCIGNLDEQQIAAAEKFAAERIKVSASRIKAPLYIEVIVFAGEHSAKVIIEDSHTNVCFIEKDGKVIKDNLCKRHVAARKKTTFGIDDIWEYVNSEFTDDELAEKIISLNTAASDEGLKNSYGLSVGKTIRECKDERAKKLLENINYILERTAAGVDARMAGAEIPVMSNSGSGNQGLITTLPVIAAAEILESSEDEKHRAVLLSSLITIYIKSRNRVLSAFCGAAIASGGVAAGITYLLKGGKAQIEMAIQNSLGNNVGMFCDGAKETCAIKIANCTFSGVYGAYLAITQHCPKTSEGIIAERAEKTIENIACICNKTSDKVDSTMIELMPKNGIKNNC